MSEQLPQKLKVGPEMWGFLSPLNSWNSSRKEIIVYKFHETCVSKRDSESMDGQGAKERDEDPSLGS